MKHLKTLGRLNRKTGILVCAYLVVSITTFSQWGTDSIYFDENWKNTTRVNAKFFRLMDVDTIKILFLVEDYYISGNLQMSGAYRSINPDVKVGEFKYWYDNGQQHIHCNFTNGILDGPYREWYKNGILKNEKKFENGFIEGIEKDWDENGLLTKSTEYKNGMKHGKFITYYPNGLPIRKDFYENDIFKKGKCFTANGEDTTYFNYFIMPKFRDGIESFKNYIHEKLNYPEIARLNDEEGQVHVRFTIDESGNVSRIKLIKEDKDYFNQEALRVVSSSPKWTPGKRDGKVIDVTITIPILFRLK
ncbi:MAG: TonB family protein [Bacteroidales bacterium]|nr:TonB family protein [Bacteroidales bacterium]